MTTCSAGESAPVLRAVPCHRNLTPGAACRAYYDLRRAASSGGGCEDMPVFNQVNEELKMGACV